jgi:MYXO-CTERM domain-containing protein
VGFVELWHNGVRVLSRFMHATMYPGQGIYLKLGLYRSDTVQPVGVVYHDGFVQATQLADVLPPTPEPVPEGEETPPVVPTGPLPEETTEEPPEEPAPEELALPGCSSAGGPLWAVALLGLGGLLRRTRRR